METKFKHIISEDKKFGYSEDFKKAINDNPGVIKDFFELTNKPKGLLGPVGNLNEVRILNNISIELIDSRGILEEKGYYHARLKNGEEFFIKTGTPYAELLSTEKAKELLSGIKGIRVIDFQAAYQAKGSENIYVTKWENLPTLEQSLWSDNRLMTESKAVELEGRLSIVRDILGSDYFDIDERNCFYDEIKDELVLFDLTKLNFKEISERTRF